MFNSQSIGYSLLTHVSYTKGLFWKGKSERPVKEGYMKLKEEGVGGGWRKYYVRLFKDHCSYYRLDNKVHTFSFDIEREFLVLTHRIRPHLMACLL